MTDVLFILPLAILGLTLALARSFHLLLGAMILAGVIQAPVITFTQIHSFQFMDELFALIFILAAVLFHVARKTPDQLGKIGLVIGFIILVLVVVAMYRSPSQGVAILQARQILMPVGLAISGAILRDEIRWRSFLTWVTALGVFVAIWMLIEGVLQRPLVDPTYYVVNVGGLSPSSFRFGLPPAYISDIDSGYLLRAAGPFMNPPIAGIFLAFSAMSALLTRAQRSSFSTGVFLVTIFVATVEAYARAGLLIIALVTVVAFFWARVGRWSAALVGVLGGTLAVFQFIDEGNTASHVVGLYGGLSAGTRSIFGEGFGASGYQATVSGIDVSDGAANESLIGLYASWFGIPVIVVIFWAVWKLWGALRAEKLGPVQSWGGIALLVAAAMSESMSSTTGSSVGWLILGLSLSNFSVDSNYLSEGNESTETASSFRH